LEIFSEEEDPQIKEEKRSPLHHSLAKRIFAVCGGGTRKTPEADARNEMRGEAGMEKPGKHQ